MTFLKANESPSLARLGILLSWRFPKRIPRPKTQRPTPSFSTPPSPWQTKLALKSFNEGPPHLRSPALAISQELKFRAACKMRAHAMRETSQAPGPRNESMNESINQSMSE
mmetsp:Transcript_6247/g.12732  ORF Transcript_6247/g.12732 Transcript_6247/m.12732 type:complete len:111 (+) Transcript_6247:1166-1498(+)